MNLTQIVRLQNLISKVQEHFELDDEDIKFAKERTMFVVTLILPCSGIAVEIDFEVPFSYLKVDLTPSEIVALTNQIETKAKAAIAEFKSDPINQKWFDL